MILKRISDKPLRPWETPVIFPATLSIADAGSIVVEVGPGRGDFLYHLAEKHPESLVVAVEIKGKRVDRLVRRLQMRGIENVMLIQSDARRALPECFEEVSIDEIHINFPDPWPKKRHTKNRLMNEGFLLECAARLKSGGTLHFSTDQEWYALEVRNLFADIASYEAQFEGGIAKDPPDAFPTLFMQKWREMGRSLYYQKYRKLT
jgi:tRNA (guanine-N7-)-methyltransferase